ncbi:hypothetical protein BZA77DRAFT_306444 [Pyronema omphalodes]|nr:hypothetical protein BZA77DRAFT_306444 [Pyronema omphalodes]
MGFFKRSKPAEKEKEAAQDANPYVAPPPPYQPPAAQQQAPPQQYGGYGSSSGPSNYNAPAAGSAPRPPAYQGGGGYGAPAGPSGGYGGQNSYGSQPSYGQQQGGNSYEADEDEEVEEIKGHIRRTNQESLSSLQNSNANLDRMMGIGERTLATLDEGNARIAETGQKVMDSSKMVDSSRKKTAEVHNLQGMMTFKRVYAGNTTDPDREKNAEFLRQTKYNAQHRMPHIPSASDNQRPKYGASKYSEWDEEGDKAVNDQLDQTLAKMQGLNRLAKNINQSLDTSNQVIDHVTGLVQHTDRKIGGATNFLTNPKARKE